MRKRLIASSAAILALSFGVVACGSDDDNGSSNDTPSENALTKTELIAQADEICSSLNAELAEKSENDIDNDASREEVIAFVSDEVIPMYEQQVEDLRALNPDESTADAFNDLTETLESEVQDIKDDPSMIFTSESAFPEATKKAKEFGLKVCGSGGES